MIAGGSRLHYVSAQSMRTIGIRRTRANAYWLCAGSRFRPGMMTIAHEAAGRITFQEWKDHCPAIAKAACPISFQEEYEALRQLVTKTCLEQARRAQAGDEKMPKPQMLQPPPTLVLFRKNDTDTQICPLVHPFENKKLRTCRR